MTSSRIISPTDSTSHKSMATAAGSCPFRRPTSSCRAATLAGPMSTPTSATGWTPRTSCAPSRILDSDEIGGPIARARELDEGVGRRRERPTRHGRETHFAVDLHPFDRPADNSLHQAIASRCKPDAEPGMRQVQELLEAIDTMAEARHDAGRGAQLAQALAAAASRPIDQVLAVKIGKHDGRLGRKPMG